MRRGRSERRGISRAYDRERTQIPCAVHASSIKMGAAFHVHHGAWRTSTRHMRRPPHTQARVQRLYTAFSLHTFSLLVPVQSYQYRAIIRSVYIHIYIYIYIYSYMLFRLYPKKNGKAKGKRNYHMIESFDSVLLNSFSHGRPLWLFRLFYIYTHLYRDSDRIWCVFLTSLLGHSGRVVNAGFTDRSQRNRAELYIFL